MKSLSPTIFLVEDDPFYLNLLKKAITGSRTCHIRSYASGEDVLNDLYRMPDVVVLDQNLEGRLSGLDVLKKIKSLNPDIHVVFLSAQEKMNVAIQSLKFGAFDYVIKDDQAFRKVNKLIGKIIKFQTMAYERKIERQLVKIGLPAFVAVLGGVLLLQYFFPGLFG